MSEGEVRRIPAKGSGVYLLCTVESSRANLVGTPEPEPIQVGEPRRIMIECQVTLQYKCKYKLVAALTLSNVISAPLRGSFWPGKSHSGQSRIV